MAFEGRSVLAVVCARGGSRGIPRKNLRKVGGVSLIACAARVALSLDWIDSAVLSTDDEEMAEEGRRHGLDVPFMRPPELASDSATSADMWRHAWLTSEEHYGRSFDLSILLQPTTPLRHAEDVERTVRTLVEGDHPAAATLARVPGHFTPEKIVTVSESGEARMGQIVPYLGVGKRSADRHGIPAYYYLDGGCYAVTRDRLVKDGLIAEEGCVGVIVDGFVINIDDPFELEIADLLARNDDKNRDAGKCDQSGGSS